MADLPHEFFAGKVQCSGGPAYWLSGGGDPTNRRDMSGRGALALRWRRRRRGDSEGGGEGEASARSRSWCHGLRTRSPPGFWSGGRDVRWRWLGSVVGEGDGVVGAGGVGE